MSRQRFKDFLKICKSNGLFLYSFTLGIIIISMQLMSDTQGLPIIWVPKKLKKERYLHSTLCKIAICHLRKIFRLLWNSKTIYAGQISLRKQKKKTLWLCLTKRFFSSKLKCLQSFKHKIAEMSGNFYLSSHIENNPKPIFLFISNY